MSSLHNRGNNTGKGAVHAFIWSTSRSHDKVTAIRSLGEINIPSSSSVVKQACNFLFMLLFLYWNFQHCTRSNSFPPQNVFLTFLWMHPGSVSNFSTICFPNKSATGFSYLLFPLKTLYSSTVVRSLYYKKTWRRMQSQNGGVRIRTNLILVWDFCFISAMFLYASVHQRCFN